MQPQADTKKTGNLAGGNFTPKSRSFRQKEEIQR